MISVKLVDVLLNQFGYTTESKIVCISNLKEAFDKEFSVTKNITKDINKKYKKYQNIFFKIMENDDFIPELSATINSYIDNSNHIISNLIHNLKNKEIQTPSYIHMLLNKIIAIHPRHHELYIYNMLRKYYLYRKHTNNVT